MNRWQQVALIVAVPAVLIGGFLIGRALGDDESAAGPVAVSASVDEFEHDFYIAEGTAARIDAGEEVEIVPAQLEVAVGESIRIVNDDVKGHTVGVFYVAAGETLTQTFQREAVLEGSCSVHPSGEFTLIVSDT